jgi:hypothetical protein
MAETIFDNRYTGPRWVYGMVNRPPEYHGAPDGRIIFADRPHPKFRHGTVEYPRQLTEAEVSGFEMVFVEAK